MKKLVIVAILASVAWSQQVEVKCQYDGYSMRNTYDSKNVNGKLTYKWECSSGHISWITNERASSGITAEQVMEVYKPLTDSLQGEQMTPEERARLTKEYQKKMDASMEPIYNWIDRLKKSDKLSAKVTLFTIRAGILYGIYALIVSL